MKQIIALMLIISIFLLTTIAQANEFLHYAISPTDVELTHIEPDVETTAVNSKRNEMMCVLKVTESNINQIESLVLPHTTFTTYHSCSTGNELLEPENLLIQNPILVDTHYEINVSYSGVPLMENEYLATFYFSTTYSYEIALNAVGQPYGIAKKSNSSTVEYTDFIERILVVAGDLNGDLIVNPQDSLLIQRYIAGQTTLTETQLIAGDVNRDGVVNIKDTLEIQNYSVSNIFTFWDYSTTSRTENPNIDTSQEYRLENVSFEKHLGIAANDNNRGYISALFSGYLKCADTSGGGSMASARNCLMMNPVKRWDDGTIYGGKQYSLIHELGHCLGARGDLNCTNSYCIMSYSSTGDNKRAIIVEGEPAFCNQCKGEMLTNLATLF